MTNYLQILIKTGATILYTCMVAFPYFCFCDSGCQVCFSVLSNVDYHFYDLL